MKLLVIGTKGQVASSLIEASIRYEIELVALGRPELDLLNTESIERSVAENKPDFVINAAAYTAVDNAEEDCQAAMAVNNYGAGALAAICANHSVPLVHLSTDYVFDGLKKQPYTENDATNPLGEYGRSKLEGEKSVIAQNPQHIILRTAWVYSPFGNNFVKTMLNVAKSRESLNVVGDQFGCPSYAPHIAEGILKIVRRQFNNDKNRAPWGIYNIAGSGQTTWYEFAREIFAQSEVQGGPVAKVHSIPTSQYPTPAKRPANSRLDCTKLKQVFGVTLPDWHDGTADCVARLNAQFNR